MNYRQRILEAAIGLPFNHITRDLVADRASVAAGMVNKCFGTVQELRRAVVAEAVRTENLLIVAQGLAGGYEEARQASESLKTRALAYLGAL